MTPAADKPLSKRGRRPKIPEGRKTHITIRLHAAERGAIDARAERLGITAGSYVRLVVLDAPVPRQARRPPVERKAIARLLGLLGNIASNINQVARAVNSGEELDDELFDSALTAIADMRAEALQALGREA
jgi:hypothetical protein